MSRKGHPVFVHTRIAVHQMVFALDDDLCLTVTHHCDIESLDFLQLWNIRTTKYIDGDFWAYSQFLCLFYRSQRNGCLASPLFVLHNIRTIK